MKETIEGQSKRLSLADAPDVLTPEQAQDLLGIGRNSVYDRIRTGEIPAIRLGRRILVPKTGIERMLNGTLR
jgi:excisionase family DNA binding protein